MALDKTTNLFEQLERVCGMLREKGENLSAKAMASCMVNAILADALDAVAARKLDGSIAEANTPPNERFDTSGLSWLMEDSDDAKKTRATIRDRYTSCITASKNFQNSYLAAKEINLLPKVEGSKDSSEFI